MTDQTSAHDPLNGYVPAGLTPEQADALRAADPDDYLARVGQSVLAHVDAIRTLGAQGAEAFDYGNALRGVAEEHGDADAFAYPGFVPAYIRPLFCEGKGPFRWVALSGDPADIAATDDAILELFGDQDHIRRWIELARERVAFQGLPARICWLGYGERHLAGLRFNELVASGKVKAPIVIGRDHLDAGRSPRPSARRRRCATARTRSPTGRSSTRSSTPPPAPRGSPSTTAAASAWACRSTPARSAWPTGPTLAAERIRRTLHRRPGDGHRPPRRRRLPRGDRGRRAARRADPDARARAMIELRGAAQVLRPPRDGALPAPRPRRRAALEPGDVALAAAGSPARRGGRRRGDRRERLRRAAGLRRLPHAPAVRRLARGGVRAQGHRRPVRGDRAGGRRHRVARRARSPPPPTRRCSRRPGRSRARCSSTARPRSRARRATGSRARARRAPRGWGASSPRASCSRCGSPACSPTPCPPGFTADAWMDEAEALARECDVDALDIFVESVAFGNEHLARMGAIAAATGRPLRAHVEQLSTMRSVPVALEHGARSRRPPVAACTRTTSRRSPPRSARRCCCRAPR